MYVRRSEPSIVFGGVDSGIANIRHDNGTTFLDAIWAGAPFASHRQFVATVERVSTEWRSAGRLPAGAQTVIVQAARRAEKDLVSA